MTDFPGNSRPVGRLNISGENFHGRSRKSIFASRGMKREIVTPKILWSPCDGERQAAAWNIALLDWEKYKTRDGKPIPDKAISYV